ncbi:hypothetical protein NECAME_01462 [Necator americanus]|uniref:Uncharacterized protein n=1 Tax=Necator americanus TaxID=51031 RepID=W2TU05_NECAM|nr:hypothetical protein NECAME_01462 [Necator americanus]ETN85570.1 hypothetical protein NECAME_01462 [Necator americanus]
MTSSGPPPTSPSKPGSFSDRYDKFIAQWPKVHTLHRMVVDGRYKALRGALLNSSKYRLTFDCGIIPALICIYMANRVSKVRPKLP